MITFLPDILPDESLLSYIGRVKDLTLVESERKIKNAFFGEPSSKINCNNPIGINEFSKRTYHFLGLSKDEVLKKFTNWPFYFHFYSDHEVNRMKEVIFSNFMTDTFISKYITNTDDIKYCPICIEDSLQKYSTPYWKRIHQIPGVELCIEHNCFLERPNIPKLKYVRQVSSHFPSLEIISSRRPRINHSTNYYNINLIVKQLLEERIVIDLDFNNRIRFSDFFSGGKVKNLNLQSAFNSFYSELRILPEFKSENITSDFISGRHGKKSYMTKLALDYFFKNYKPIQLVCNERTPFWDRHLFGNGPWNCLNVLCTHYNSNVILTANFRYEELNGKTIGHFDCPICNSSYSKSFNWVGNEFKSYIKGGKKSVKQQRELFFYYYSLEKITYIIRNKISVITTWLRRHDKDWYEKQSYKIKEFQKKRREEKKDSNSKAIFLKLSKSLNHLRSINPPFRISVSKILAFSNVSYSSCSKIERDFLNSNEESVQNFRIRRLHFIKDELLKKGEQLTLSKLLIKFHSKIRKELSLEAIKILNNIGNN
ncbi:MAG: TnsD family Tn7-like transposition protein [Chryseotalea sp.]|jgi:hypothetical protein